MGLAHGLSRRFRDMDRFPEYSLHLCEKGMIATD